MTPTFSYYAAQAAESTTDVCADSPPRPPMVAPPSNGFLDSVFVLRELLGDPQSYDLIVTHVLLINFI